MKRVIADGAYDSKENFRYLFDNGIEAAIKVRKNSSDRSMGCYPRKIAVLKQMKNFEKWKDSVSYGYRSIYNRNNILFHEKDIWRICICQKISKHG